MIDVGVRLIQEKDDKKVIKDVQRRLKGQIRIVVRTM